MKKISFILFFISSFFIFSLSNVKAEVTMPTVHLDKTVIEFTDDNLDGTVNFTLSNTISQNAEVSFNINASDTELVDTHNPNNKLGITTVHTNNKFTFLSLTSTFANKSGGNVKFTTEKATKTGEYIGKSTISMKDITIYNEGVYAKLYDTTSDGKGDTLVLNNYPNFASEGTLITNYENKDSTSSRQWTASSDITKVDILNEIKPEKTNNWFQNFINLTTINNISNLDTSRTTTMFHMFNNCKSLTTLDLHSWNTSNATNMANMFSGCNSLTTLDVSNFNTKNVLYMQNMFENDSMLTTLDVSGFDTSKVTDMQFMFNGCSSLNELDVSNFDTSNVTSMDSMFKSVSSVTTLDVSHFNTSNVVNMHTMFNFMDNVTELKVDNFDTSKVTNMIGTFSNIPNITSLNLSNWDTSNVTNMYSMFTMWDGRTNDWNTMTPKLETIIFGDKFDTSKVTNMIDMFSGQSNIETLDLYTFDTSSLTDAMHIFNNMNNLKTIYSKDWDKTNLNEKLLFGLTPNLTGGNGTSYSNAHMDKAYARLDLHGQAGYFTSKNKYNITYELGGGTISEDAWTHYFKEDPDYTIPTPVKEGYEFLGWTGDNGTTPQKDVVIPSGTTGNKTYIANWDSRQYTISFVSKDMMENQTLYQVGEGDEYSDDLTNKIYTVTRHSKSAGYYLKQTFSLSGTYLLDYKVQKISGTLRNLAGHSPFASNQVFKIDDSVMQLKYDDGLDNVADDTLVHHVQVKFDYDGSGGVTNDVRLYIQPNRGVSDIDSVKAKITDVHLYQLFASYERNTNEEIGTLPTPTPPTGYKFIGWYTAQTGGTKVSKTTKVTKSMTLYPRYVSTSAALYSISYRNMTDTSNYENEVYKGETFELDLSNKKYNSISVYSNNTKITNFTYNNYILTIPNVSGNLIIMSNDFNYCGITPGMLLYADYDNSTNTKFGDLSATSGTLNYNDDHSLALTTSSPSLQYKFDASMKLSNEYTIMTTVKAPTNQVGNPGSFAATIAAISYDDGSYLTWIGYYKNFFNYLSYSTDSSKAKLTSTTSGTGYTSFDASAYDGKTVTIIVTSKRGGQTKVYFNGVLKSTFTAGTSATGYKSIMINELRAGRGLKMNADMYDIAFYNRQLTDAEVQTNWACEQTKWTYD